MKELLKAGSRISISVVANFAVGFIRNKLFALILGVTGLGILGQLLNLNSFIVFVAPLGISLGVTQYIAKYRESDPEIVKGIFMSFTRLLIIPTIITMFIIIFFSNEISSYLFKDESYNRFIIAIAVFVPFTIFSVLLDSYLKGFKNIKVYTNVSVLTTVVSLVFTIPLLLIYGLFGALIGMLSISVMQVLLIYLTLWKKGFIPSLRHKFSIDNTIIKDIFKIGIAALISGGGFQLALLINRVLTLENFGNYGNGLYQAVLSISISYFSIVFMSLSIYTHPRISSIIENAELIHELNLNLRYVMLITVPLVSLLVVFKEFLIKLFFSGEFIPAGELFIYQFIGDFFKAISWVFGIWLVPRMQLKAFVIFDLILFFNLVVIYYILIVFLGKSLVYVSIAYLLSYLLHTIINYVYIRKKLGFKVNSKNILILVSSIVLIIVTYFAVQFDYILGYVIVFPLLAVWLRLSVSNEEFLHFVRYSKLKIMKK